MEPRQPSVVPARRAIVAPKNRKIATAIIPVCDIRTRSEDDPDAVDYTPELTQGITAGAIWLGDLVHRDCPAYSAGEFKK